MILWELPLEIYRAASQQKSHTPRCPLDGAMLIETTWIVGQNWDTPMGEPEYGTGCPYCWQENPGVIGPAHYGPTLTDGLRSIVCPMDDAMCLRQHDWWSVVCLRCEWSWPT